MPCQLEYTDLKCHLLIQRKKKSTRNSHKKACYKSNITYAHLYRCSAILSLMNKYERRPSLFYRHTVLI